jgi:cytochrome b561
MLLRNTLARFGFIAVSFHWVIALLFLNMLAIGLTMTSMALGNPWMFPLFQFHKSLGTTIFVLAVARLLWRGINVTPLLPQGMPRLEKFAAKATHWALYAALLLMPLSGWVIVSASPLGIPTVIFGLIELPHLDFVVTSAHRKLIGEWASLAHWAAAWSAMGLIGLHAAAALRHHFWLKDNVLRQMLFTRDLFQKEEPK